MDNLPDWVQALLCMYLLGGFLLPILYQTIELFDGEPKMAIFGCVIETYITLKDKLNTTGLMIAVVFMAILTLPAIIACSVAYVCIALAQSFWQLYMRIFRKNEKAKV